MTPPAVRFLTWGRENGQFAGVVLGVIGTLIYTGVKAQKQFDDLDKRMYGMEKGLKADILREQNDRFLMYGYAEEFQRYRKSSMPESKVTKLEIDK